jgi:hypothetical protein
MNDELISWMILYQVAQYAAAINQFHPGSQKFTFGRGNC